MRRWRRRLAVSDLWSKWLGGGLQAASGSPGSVTQLLHGLSSLPVISYTNSKRGNITISSKIPLLWKWMTKKHFMDSLLIYWTQLFIVVWLIISERVKTEHWLRSSELVFVVLTHKRKKEETQSVCLLVWFTWTGESTSSQTVRRFVLCESKAHKWS